MTLSLSTKKRILSISVGILLTGNIIRLFAPSEIVVLEGLAKPFPTYASEGIDHEMLILPEYDFAYEKANSLSIQTKISNLDVDQVKVQKIERYLSSRGSPMAPEAATFVRMAELYGLPYNLMPAIAVIESGGGKHNYRPYNYAGMGGQSRAISFENYSQAIEKHAQILRNGYFSKGATTPEAIGKYYCFNCPTWGSKVQGVMNAIEAM